MRPSRLLIVLIACAGAGVGLALPRWRITTIVFEPGGRVFHLENEATRPLPGTLEIVDDGRLRLHVINRDTIPHAAGVLGLQAQDSAIVSAELCTGTHEHGAATLVLR